MSLNNHGALLAEAGRRAEALPVSPGRLSAWARAGRPRPATPTADLAIWLDNYPTSWGRGPAGEAVPLSQEAVDLRRELVALFRPRDAYLPEPWRCR